MEVLYKIKNPTLLIAGSDDSDAASQLTHCCSKPLLKLKLTPLQIIAREKMQHPNASRGCGKGGMGGCSN